MKSPSRDPRRQRGVSPVVGTILLISLAVAGAGIIAVALNSIRVSPPAPHVSLWVIAENIDSENVRVTIFHRGGDTLNTSEINVKVQDATMEIKTLSMNWGERFSVGESSSGIFTYGSSPEGKEITVKIVHYPSSQLILDTTVEVG